MLTTNTIEKSLDFQRIFFFSLFSLSIVFWLNTNQDDPIIIKVLWSLVLLSFLLYWSHFRSIEWYLSVILVGLCLRFWMVSFEDFSQLPTQDSIQDFQVFLTFIETDSIFVLPSNAPRTVQGTLSNYSAFPIIHSLAASFSIMTGIKSYFLAYAIITWLYLAFVCSVLSLVMLLSSGASLNPRIASVGLIVVCFEPISVYWTGQMVRQLIGLVLVITFYSLILLFTESKYRIRLVILASLVCILQPASHHLSSANAIALVSGISIVLLVLSYLSPKFREELPRLSFNTVMNMIVILSVTFL